MGQANLDRSYQSSHERQLAEPALGEPAGLVPGRQTLVQREALAGEPHGDWASPPTGAPAVQREADGSVETEARSEGSGGDSGDVQARAARGVAGPGGPLPHLDRIQRLFGRHDVSATRAHVGGDAASAARSIGAGAYAMGDAVAFSSAPDLRQAAHEAAHVVQQRGGVQLDGGVGQAGDRYEHNADEVAAAVVRGESAEALLDPFAGQGGAPGVQRDPETLEQVQQAIDAASADELRPTLSALDRQAGRRGRRAELTIPIGRTEHQIRTADLSAVRTHVIRRLTALGAVRSPAQEQAIIDAAIRAVVTNESGGRSVATESAMDTSAPNPREPGRGQHASYASASQMIPSHAVSVLGRSPETRRFAAEHGLSEGDLRDAAAVIQASGRIWDAVVKDSWTYERLLAHRGRAEDLALTGFTREDIARMAQFGAFRALLLSRREQILGVRAQVIATLEREATQVEARIAQLRAETAPATDGAAPAAADEAHEPDAATTAAPDTEPATGSDHSAAALAALSPRQRAPVAAVHEFALPARWSAMTASARRNWLASAVRRLAAARRSIERVASAAADAFTAAEIANDPAVAPLQFSQSTIRAYIHSESHFLQRFNEDRGGWSRRALQNRALGGGSMADAAAAGAGTAGRPPARSLDDAIAAAAADQGGHRLTQIDLGGRLREYVRAHPLATDDEIVGKCADLNSGGSSEYRAHILGIYHRQRSASATPEAAPAS